MNSTKKTADDQESHGFTEKSNLAEGVMSVIAKSECVLLLC